MSFGGHFPEGFYYERFFQFFRWAFALRFAFISFRTPWQPLSEVRGSSDAADMPSRIFHTPHSRMLFRGLRYARCCSNNLHSSHDRSVWCSCRQRDPGWKCVSDSRQYSICRLYMGSDFCCGSSFFDLTFSG